MKKFEYNVHSTMYPLSVSVLDSYGKEGWELVNVIIGHATNRYLFYFKRVVEEKPPVPLCSADNGQTLIYDQKICDSLKQSTSNSR